MIIDVSHHQGKIDWARVKPQIDAAILRCGYSTSGKDRCFEYNATECERLGIPYGVYFYSYAQNVPTAAIEAQHCLDLLKGRKVSGHVWFDSEQDGTQTVARSAAELFCRTVKAAGYKPGIYASESWFKRYLKGMGYPTWVAKYGANNGAAGVRPNIGEAVNLWQYTSRGIVNGISGGVDVSQIITAFAQPTNHKSVTEIAQEVLAGKWGNGTARKKRIESAGYSYTEVQAEVNRLSKQKKSAPAKKTNETVAREVLAGKWGNGITRRLRLTKAGYNYAEIQKLINKLK